MPKTPGDTFDPGTDPGRPHPYESLYRASGGVSAQPSRPTPRHFEPALSPPEGADNGFGWLFREEPTGAEVPAGQPSSADTADEGATVPRRSVRCRRSAAAGCSL